jgi:hypothetical protein
MDGDNGKIQPNTEQPSEAPKIKVKPLMVLSVGEDKHVYMTGDFSDKELCFEAMAEAIKFIAHYKPAIVPSRNGMMDFARRITGRK